MTLKEYVAARRLSWMHMAHMLTDAAKENGGDPIYYHRLWRLRTGRNAATESDRRALAVVTRDEVESYKG